MSLSYSAQFPYPVPSYHRSNPIYGQSSQALGPYPPLGGAGYGFPPGLEAGSLAAPNILNAADNTVALQCGLSLNMPSQAWQFFQPEVKVIDMNKAEELMEYLNTPRSATRLHTSTLGSVSMDNSGYVTYSNMGPDRSSHSFGRYNRK